LFAELWDAAPTLTDDKLKKYEEVYNNLRKKNSKVEEDIEAALGQAQPGNINVKSHKKSNKQNSLENLRRQVYEQFLPAFKEVTTILEKQNLRRPELADIGIENEASRFLNYVYRTHVKGNKTWKTAQLKSADESRRAIEQLAQKWVDAKNNEIPEDHPDWLLKVQVTFGTREAIVDANKDQIMDGLMSLHAFSKHIRRRKSRDEFWKNNNHDLDHVKSELTHLIHGHGDFIERFHDLIDGRMKLEHIGYFSALELFGTIKPDECPPMNGRIAKALRFLGFDVKAE
jgi:hypothetical protein